MATNPAATTKGAPNAPKPAPIPGAPLNNPVIPNANVPPRTTAPAIPPAPVAPVTMAPPPPSAPLTPVAATPPPVAVTEGEAKPKGRKKKGEQTEGQAATAETKKEDETPKWSRPQLKKMFDHRRAPHMLLEKGIIEQITGMTRRYYKVKEGQKMPSREEFDAMGKEHFGSEEKFTKYRVKRPRKAAGEATPATGAVTAPQTTANATNGDDDEDDDDE